MLHGWGLLLTLPKLSIAASSMRSFALMATTTIALSVVAVTAARHHAASDRRIRIRQCRHLECRAGERVDLCRSDGIARRLHVERHGDIESYADGILKFNKQIAKVVEDWEKSVRGDDDTELFAQFSKRIALFIGRCDH